ncbi:glycosyltransferase family 39 protein [Candidatus Saccharibacteria bacterium]|nr:glycosyltransferase family 39 protein [Candidatus Saccharibacteria bacterium]
MGIDVTSFYVYRWRYWIGYSLIGILLVGLLIFAGLYVPGGISNKEVISVIKSSSISVTDVQSLAVTDLPYHLLQKVSLAIFGVSDFSIKLPSLIIGLFSAVGLIFLIRLWFRPNVAVLTSGIAVTTGQFLFTAQSGNPSIMYIFWSVWLLLLGTLIAKRVKPRTTWKVLFFVVAALSLYTPLSIYALISMAVAILLHPHLRYIIRQLSKPRLAGAFLLGVIVVIPLAIGVIKSPELGLTLLGVPTQWPNFGANLVLLSQQYLGFALQSATGVMTPFFGLGSVLIIGLGAYRLFSMRQSAQTYLIITWLVCLVPIMITNPRFMSVAFLPLVLLLATGLNSLFRYWYSLFPNNPYARILGLLPLGVLVIALIFSGLERYIYGYHYAPQTVQNFSQDLSLLPKNTRNLVVTASQLPFYNVVAAHNKNLAVSTAPSSNTFVSTFAAKKSYTGYSVERIVTSTAYQNSDRFYVYKKVN